MPSQVGQVAVGGEQGQRRRGQGEVAGASCCGPEPVEVLSGSSVTTSTGPSVGRVRIDQRQVARWGRLRVERDVDQLVLAALGEERLAALGTAEETVLERADAIEAGAVRALVDRGRRARPGRGPGSWRSARRGRRRR